MLFDVFITWDFNPLPPGGGRPIRSEKAFTIGRFQSTPSGWRETGHLLYIHCVSSNFNPLPPGGGRRALVLQMFYPLYISIHSLRVEGDQYPCNSPIRHLQISIHSLRVEGDLVQVEKIILTHPFQSTPSGWRETAYTAMYGTA